jgi:hypothetical protein
MSEGPFYYFIRLMRAVTAVDFQIIPTDLLDQYKILVSEEALTKAFDQLHDVPLSTDSI